MCNLPTYEQDGTIESKINVNVNFKEMPSVERTSVLVGVPLSFQDILVDLTLELELRYIYVG